MTTANQLAGYASSLPSLRNRIINGAMTLDQRNAGSSASFTSAGYSLDRWVGAITVGSGHTIQKSSTAPVGQSTSALITVGTGASPALGNVNRLYQVVEGYNIADLNWGTLSAATVTLSFWVRSSVTGTFSGALYGGSPIQSYAFSYLIDDPNVWETKSVTISGPTTGTWDSTNNAGVYVNFDLGSGDNFKTTAGAWASSTRIGVTGATNLCETSGATFYITGVQLEEGTVATPFEHRPISVELSLCQRYYEKSFNADQAPTTGVAAGRIKLHNMAAYAADTSHTIEFKITKRATPDMTAFAQSGTTPTFDNFGVNGGNMFVSSASAGSVHYSHYIAESEL